MTSRQCDLPVNKILPADQLQVPSSFGRCFVLLQVCMHVDNIVPGQMSPKFQQEPSATM